MNSKAPKLLAGQSIHLIGLIILLPLSWKLWQYAGSPHPRIFWTCILIPTLHQIYVWLTWRLELQDGSVSRTVGFKGYLFFFFVFLILRPISILALAYADANTLEIPHTLRILLTAVLIIPALYTVISIKKYFGFKRAAGADHFLPEYRSMPLVKEGIFKYTGNGMYVYGFFMLWAIAIGFGSRAALIVAGFSHVSIWIHYHATEKPDMAYLYARESI